MALDDKLKNMAQDVAGKAKEAAGKVTGNEDLQAHGQADQDAADVKQAGEHAKDAARDTLS